jgi:hypothetical protein
MTASNLRKREAADAPQGQRRVTRALRGLGGRLARVRTRPRSRRLELAGLLIGLAVGLVLALTARPYGGQAPAAPPPAGPPAGLEGSYGTTLAPQPGVGPLPTALDAEWAAYSDRSTCADWAGGDGISAVRLSSSQIAWFFSDSYLGPATPSSGFSHSAGLVHNSVVVQTRSGNGSGFVTLTGGGVCSSAVRPDAVVGPPQAPGGRNVRYWAEDGIKIGGLVIKFYNSYRLGNAPYIPTGTVLATFPAGQLSSAGSGQADGVIATPQLLPLPSYAPPGNDSPIVWGAAVLRAGNTVYVYGTQTPDTLVPDRQLYLARVPASQLTEFAAWQFYAGSGRWTASQSAAQPLQPPASSLSVSSGFSVVPVGQRYWLIQANPIAGNQDIDAYPASAPWGPFDQAAGIVVYRDPGMGLDAAHDFRLMYEARAEPAVSTSRTLVISYNVNSIGNTAGCIPMSWFSNTVTLPRFIAVPLTMFSTSGTAASGAKVTAGPSDYPQVAQQDPAQWFDEWDYPNGCPPVPGVTSVRASARPGAVTLSWPDAGLGVGYRVYVRAPGAAGWVLETTVSFVLSPTARTISATLTGLPAGNYAARVVPLNLRQQAGHMAQVSFTVPGG